MTQETGAMPFSSFAPPVREQSALRQRITAAYRRPERECVSALLAEATLPAEARAKIAETARHLVMRLRSKGEKGGVDALVKEFSLSSQEGVALMCLAEALLRIPDAPTRDALIRDKLSHGNWKAHIGEDRPVFVNAATWGLVISGKLTSTVSHEKLDASLSGMIARWGEPVIRAGVNMAMQLMGEQFVKGESIGEAIRRSHKQEAQGFSFSYDMLGEAAMTAADADRYYRDYESALDAIGAVAGGRGIYAAPGISIKLSALHPRYSRAQAGRVMAELLPRVRRLALMAKRYDVGFNIDAEEADRLELSLDILEELALDPQLAGWQGLGFVLQAYGKRCPAVIDWIIDLGRRTKRRIMVRLVKGAYWDTEIKRAQVDGLVDFPVFTRKVHTDVSYIACARRLLAAKDAVFPQFATHNAQTLATIYHLAGEDFHEGDYEFQCLHGMGDVLYEEVVGKAKLDRPCRIYAPVGNHETLLAYLVRRLLENGANSSFVNQVTNADVEVDRLIADPADLAAMIQPIGSGHELIRLPHRLYEGRENSSGLDLTDETVLDALSRDLRANAATDWRAEPMVSGLQAARLQRDVLNPADHRDRVGKAAFALERDARLAAMAAKKAAAGWAQTPVGKRADCLDAAADLMQARMPQLLGLAIREAGKSMPNAIAEVREAIDFLRYYAMQARATLDGETGTVGPVVCISPWNFPLAIFTGQVAAALVAGNPVLAKPAEETPLIAAEAVRILHAAGVPEEVLQFIPGDGVIGAALVNAPEICGVIFTGSTEVARLIQSALAGRTLADGTLIPFIAETGGQNAMIVDSSALPEQVVTDVLASAFDSAGQRCSALRILCVQEDVADSLLAMIEGAMAELSLASPDRLSTDVGPVISAEARQMICDHIERMRKAGCRVSQPVTVDAGAPGTFVPPTVIEIDNIGQLGREVFGPVLHVMRYRRKDIGNVIAQINATGYGLTFGLHTRIDETIEYVSNRVTAGNIYINRNVIGAIVGVQPFGGRGLSGSGPKAGGPLYLGRLITREPSNSPIELGPIGRPSLDALIDWLDAQGEGELAASARLAREGSPRLTTPIELPGPVGERNLYELHPRGLVLLLPESRAGLIAQLVATFATGNRPALPDMGINRDLVSGLPIEVSACIEWVEDWQAGGSYSHVLVERSLPDLADNLTALAAIDGSIPIVQVGDAEHPYRRDWMVEEISTSINTTAAGGNASLMALV